MRNAIIPAVMAMAVLVAIANADKKPETKAVAKPAVAKRVKPQPAAMELRVYSDEKTCQPCRDMAPVVRQFESKNNDVRVRHCNAADVPRIPTFVALRSGVEVGRIVGKTSVDELQGLFNRKSPESAPAPAIHEVKPAVEPTPAVTKGPKGWRLRLLYPAGDKTGAKLARMFENRMPVITKQYGYQAITTESDLFAPWKKLGYEADRVTLVLVNAAGDVVYRTNEPPTEIEELRAVLRAKAAEANLKTAKAK